MRLKWYVQKSAATEAQPRNGKNLAILERRHGANLRCRHSGRAAKPIARATS
jgi:hypothetical protein